MAPIIPQLLLRLVGVAAFSGSLCGSKLIPSKWRCLVPPRRIEPVEITSGYPTRQDRPRGCFANASRWAVVQNGKYQYEKYISIFLVLLLALVSANACVSMGTLTPTSMPTYTPQITLTLTPTPVIYPVHGYDILLSPEETKKAVYDAHIGRTFEVIDANGKVLWSITYDSSKFDLAEPWYKPFYWSKDEKFLYYTCFHGQETDGSSKFYGNEFIDGCGVFRLNVETGETIDILPEIAPGNGYYAFSISPDEKHLVYTDQNETPVQIKLLDMSTREEQILLTADENILETGRFGWSPEGDKLAFMTLRISDDEKRFYSVFILDLKSLETKLLVKDFETRIRFVSWDEHDVISYEPDDSGYIWQLSIESEMFSLVTPTPWATSTTPTQ